MADIRIITGKNIIPEFSAVLKLFGCKGGEKSQEEVKKQFDILTTVLSEPLPQKNQECAQT